MTEALHIYRSLIRAINRNVTTINGNPQWLYFAQEQFREHARARAAKNAGEHRRTAANKVQDAADYAFLINSIKEHKELLLSYNVGIPIDVREKNMNARAASFVGLAMPIKEVEA